MRRALCLIVPSIAVALFACHVRADSEPIGPLLVVPGQPIVLYFGNFLPPDPDHKILQFTGWANSQPGIVSVLNIAFDYWEIDPTGAGHEVLLPGFIIPLTGGPQKFETPLITLPFCPDRVSIHFGSNAPIEVSGTFLHECVPVPLPNAAAMGTLALSLVTLLPRRRAA